MSASARPGQHVADAAPGRDQCDGLATVHLATQPAHVDVDEVRERIVIVVPDVRVDLGARDDAAGVAHEMLEQRVLLRRERDLALPASSGMAARIHDEFGHRELVGKHVAATSDESTESCEELTEVERLREIIVGAGVQAGDLVLDGIARREHEDGCAGTASANLATDLYAVARGEDDVEDDGIVLIDRGEKDRA